MGLKTEDRTAIINYRLEQAQQAAKDAKLLLDNGSFSASVNRIYYSIFYVISALALKNSFITSKHQQLIGWFNKNFIHKKIVDKRLGKIVKAAFEQRSESDYGEFVEYNKCDVEDLYNDMKEFISTVSLLIK